MFERLKGAIERVTKKPSTSELVYNSIKEDEFNLEVHPEFGADLPDGEYVLPAGTAFAWIHWTGNGRYNLEYRRTAKDCVISLHSYSPEEGKDVRGFGFGDSNFLLKVK
jgi:hypothetical protein